jgi:hypothetical protein
VGGLAGGQALGDPVDETGDSMSDERDVDQQRVGRWLELHGQAGDGKRARFARALVSMVMAPGSTDDDIEFAIDMVMEPPDWLAIRTLSDGRFAGVMPQLFGGGKLGVNHPPGHPCTEMEVFAATWDYERAIDAITALNAWDTTVSEEPAGYLKRCEQDP